LAQKWMAVSTKEKKAKSGQRGSRGGSRDKILDFWDPQYLGDE